MKLRGLSHDLAALVREGKATRTEQKGGVVYTITDEKEAIRLAEGLKGIKREPNPPLVNLRSDQNGRENTMDDFWIEQGWFRSTRYGIRLTRAKWQDDPETMNRAVKFLIEEVLKIDPRNLRVEHFHDNRLRGLIGNYHNNSPFSAISEVYPEINAWEMIVTPYHYFNERSNRIAATKWLVEQKLKKDPRDMIAADFTNNRLWELLAQHNNSPHAVISEAYSEIRPWEMPITPYNYFNEKPNRVVAVRWLVEEKLKKDPRDVCGEDFRANRLPGLLSHNFRNSPYLAISEAYPEIKSFEMINRPKHI